jgi:hypothetical protein
MRTQPWSVIAAASLMFSSALAAPVKTELKIDGTNHQLIRDGKPYFIQGAGGDGSKEFLKQIGGNSFRTWGIDENTQAKLDEAHKLGLTVTLGIWLGHERHGFNYSDGKAVREQFEKAREAVRKYKDHPALLMWSVGNEMEGFKEGDNPAIWAAVQNIAAMIKKEDPNHPVMTVIAEIGGQRVASIHDLCPSVDIIGINTYGGGPTIAERYRKLGGTKPYIITEYGPAGTWEVEKNNWGAPRELSSTAKALSYRATYEKTILAEKDKLCLGGYAFAWGNKQEATATWFGLFLDSGERLEATDTLTELWTGKGPANRCPQIQPLKVVGADRVKPGESIFVQLDVADPEKDPLRIEWKLHKDLSMYEGGGDAQHVPPSYPEAILKRSESEVELKMPADGGGYWLYAIVHDDKNGAAVANIPLFVESEKKAEVASKKAELPFVLFGEGQKGLPYVWSGWMGKVGAIGMDEKHTIQPQAGTTCMKLEYRAPNEFGGIIWQSPANDWGDAPGGYDLTGATKLTFYARGDAGGEKVDFVFGVIKGKAFNDSADGSLRGVILDKEWKQYTIELEGKDLSHIKTGFGWSLGGQGKPVTFYLDEIRFE